MNHWRSPETAPKDGTLLRLLVEHDEDGNPLEDSAGPTPTIGFNNLENDGEDQWQMAGWCWSHDHFTEGRGKVVGWLPFDDGELRQWINDLQSGMYINCVYCGHRYGPSDEVPASMAEVLKAHVEQCPEHPMSKLRTAAKALADDVEDTAKRSYSYLQGSWPEDWQAEDPEGYAVWRNLIEELGGENA